MRRVQFRVNVRIRDFVERKIIRRELVVRPKMVAVRSKTSRVIKDARIDTWRLVPEPWVKLVFGAIIRASMEVTAGARLPVAADLLVPEERLAQDLQGLPAAWLWDTGVSGTRVGSDEGVEIRGIRHRHSLE